MNWKYIFKNNIIIIKNYVTWLLKIRDIFKNQIKCS